MSSLESFVQSVDPSSESSEAVRLSYEVQCAK